LRRAAISIASNIVEGAARSSLPEYMRFLEIAYGSAKEVEYQLSIAERLGYGQSDTIRAISDQASETAKVLNGLIRALRDKS
jgi:four helix bundle protein